MNKMVFVPQGTFTLVIQIMHADLKDLKETSEKVILEENIKELS